MSSGCILGVCPACGENIYEDEWAIVEDVIIHERCRQAYIRQKFHISEAQYSRLIKAEQLRREIEETKNLLAQEIKYLKDTYSAQIKDMENRLLLIESADAEDISEVKNSDGIDNLSQ